jgi:hypothetical protein
MAHQEADRNFRANFIVLHVVQVRLTSRVQPFERENWRNRIPRFAARDVWHIGPTITFYVCRTIAPIARPPDPDATTRTGSDGDKSTFWYHQTINSTLSDRGSSAPFFPVAREAGLGKKSISKCTQRLNSLCDCRRGRDLLLANHFAHNCQLIIDVETTPLGKRKKLDGLRARRKEWDTTR